MKSQEYGRILYINTAVRACSRTARLAGYLLDKLGGADETVCPHLLGLPETDEAFLEMRNAACASQDFSAPIFGLAKQFKEAETLVIAAPFWDLSFPSALKRYLEHINVLNLTFGYTADGKAMSLCKTKRVFYVTTAGGFIPSTEYGFGYVKAFMEYFCGVGDCVLFKAEGLDIFGSDTAARLEAAKREIDG